MVSEEEDGDAEETQDSEGDEEDEMEEDDDDSDYPEEMEDDDDDASYCTESSFRSHSTYSSTPGTRPAPVRAPSPPPATSPALAPLGAPPPPPRPGGGEMRRCIPRQKNTSSTHNTTRFTGGKRLIVQNGDCIVAVCRPHARSLARWLSFSAPHPLLFLFPVGAGAASRWGRIETSAHAWPLHLFSSPGVGLAALE